MRDLAPKASSERTRLALESRRLGSLRPVSLGAGPLAPDLFFDACAAFVMNDQKLANALIERAITKNPDLIWSQWFNKYLPIETWRLLGDETLHPWFYLQGAYALFQRREMGAAIAVVDHALSLGPVDNRNCEYRLHEVRCEAFLQDKNFTDPSVAESISEYLSSIDPDGTKPWAALYRGCIDFHQGRMERAADRFREFADHPFRFSFAAIGARSFRPTPIQHGQLDLPAIDFVVTPKQSRPVVVFCADATYFARFAPLIVASACAFGVDANLHFHIVGPYDPVPLEKSGVDVSWIEERVGLSREDDHNLGKAFYASVRFLRAEELLQHYGQQLIFSDIDCAFVSSGAEFFDAVGRLQGAFLRKNVENHMPWRFVTANLFVLQDGWETRQLLGTISSMLRNLFAEESPVSKSNWWCDQNALGIGVKLHESKLRDYGSLFDIRRVCGGYPMEFAPNHSARKVEFIERHSKSAQARMNREPIG